MNKTLSVIIPVYNVEQYINKCLDSLVLDERALMEQMEVIIVNDGTPDRSAELSREYVRRYPDTFRQIDKENGGHGSAWNVGLEEATGKYVRYLDSDDWFTNLDRLIVDLEECDADIVFNPYIKEYYCDNRSESIDTIPISGVSRIYPPKWGNSKWGYNNVNFWSTTYKTDLLKPLQPLFVEKAMYDDYIITWAPLVLGRTYTSLDYPVYHYLIGRTGQSISAIQKRNMALSYTKCFTQFESVRSRIDGFDVPSDLLACIDRSIVGYANYVFPKMIYLPLKDALDRMGYLWNQYLADIPEKSKLLKRYASLPAIVFYYVEHLRRMINKA